jgi:hypothetical protein
VNDVKLTIYIALVLVVLVIFLFLRNLSATVVPSLALPLAIVGTFAVMYLLGYSVDNLSLMAMTLSIGFVVDDAIVMLENIVRHMEAGEKPFEAAIKGAREIGFTIVSMTLSLAAVFIPMLFHGRNHRAFVPRILDGHCRRNSHFRICIADPHADVVQSLSPAAGAERTWGHVQHHRAGVSMRCCVRTNGASDGCCGIGRLFCWRRF